MTTNNEILDVATCDQLMLGLMRLLKDDGAAAPSR